MAGRYAALHDERGRLIDEAEAMFAAAEADGNRELTAEEKATDDRIVARLKEVEDEIEREERRSKRLEEPVRSYQSIEVGRTREVDKPWASLGEQLSAIALATTPGGMSDPRLYKAVSGASSGIGSDGGFLVQKDYSTQLLETAMQTSVLAPYCTQIPIGAGSDGLEAPMFDETDRANGSRFGGVRVYRAAEGATVTATKPKFRLFDLRLEDMIGIAYATERLIRDASALESIFTTAFASEFAFKLDDEIINGTGAGQCLGVLSSGALVSVAKETGQAATTVVAQNIMKMRQRLHARSRAKAVWLINQDVETQLESMTLPVGTGGVPVYMPASGLSTTGYDTLFGRPVISIEQCATLGTPGDVLLADLSQYVLITKGGIQADQSIHVKFIYNERTFRWVYPINGAPTWYTYLTPYKGTGNTVSPFVVTAVRA